MWDVLAIAPTDDAKAIRRAYAARLREIDPDRDRAAFARLRAALEWALAGDRRASSPPNGIASADVPPPEVPLDDEPPEAVETVHLDWMPEPAALSQPPRDDEPPQAIDTVHLYWTQPPPAPRRESGPEIAGERAQERALLIALEQALQRGDAGEAKQFYFRAAATGAVPLGNTERMLVRLFTVALDDPEFDGPAFRELAKTFGWDRPELDSEAVSSVRQRVSARLAAEDWYDALVALADRQGLWSGRRKSRVARLVLRRIRGWGLLRIDRDVLRTTLGTLKPHEVLLRDRIPPAWVATLERRMRRRELIAGGWWILFLGFWLLDAAWAVIGGSLGLIKDESTFAMLLVIAVAAFLAWALWALVKNFIGMWRSPR
jgi:hypothetical protein